MRKKKTFPPGTFIPTPQRFIAIVQLCFAFSLLLWHATQPFMGEYFQLRSRMLLYEYAMGSSTLLKSQPGHEARMERNAHRFDRHRDRGVLQTDYQKLQEYATRPVSEKIEAGLRGLIQQVPPFEQAWIFFSIVISILILMKREGAKQAAWLLPLIVIAFAADNMRSGKPHADQPDASLFPTEDLIVQNYLQEPLGSTPQIQKEQLERGWKSYLVDNWSSELAENEEQKLEVAEYNFTLARLHLLHAQPRSEWLYSYHEQLSGATLLIYLLWNGWFAWVVSGGSRSVWSAKGLFRFLRPLCVIKASTKSISSR